MALSLSTPDGPVRIFDPSVIQELATHYRAICTQIGNVNNQLRAAGQAQQDGSWTGQAADAFASQLGNLPGELDQAWQSYNHLAWCMWQFGDDVSEAVSDLQTRVQRLDEARTQLDNAQRVHDDAVNSGVDPNSTGISGALQSAKDDYQNRSTDLQNALEAMSDLQSWCVNEIQNASNLGITNSFGSFADRYVVQDIGGTTVEVVSTAAALLKKIVIDPFTHLLPDLVTFIHDPSWKNLSAVLGDVAGIVGLASLLIPGVGEVLMGLSLALTATQTVVDVGSALEDGGSWLSVGGDLLGLATMGLGEVGGKAIGEGGEDAINDFRTGTGATAQRLADNARSMGMDDAADMFENWRGTKLASLAGDKTEQELWSKGLQNALPHSFGLKEVWSAMKSPVVTGFKDTIEEFKNPRELLNNITHMGVMRDVDLAGSSAIVQIQHIVFTANVGTMIIGAGIGVATG